MLRHCLLFNRYLSNWYTVGRGVGLKSGEQTAFLCYGIHILNASSHQIRLHSPITNLEHPFALSVSDDAAVRTPFTQAAERAWLLLTRNAKGCSKLVIGECRVLISGTGRAAETPLLIIRIQISPPRISFDTPDGSLHIGT